MSGSRELGIINVGKLEKNVYGESFIGPVAEVLGPGIIKHQKDTLGLILESISGRFTKSIPQVLLKDKNKIAVKKAMKIALKKKPNTVIFESSRPPFGNDNAIRRYRK